MSKKIINAIKGLNDKYSVVYFDDGFLFKAQNWEIKQLSLEVDMDVPFDLFDKIYQEFGIKRCRFKAVDILSRTDKSEFELRRKLQDCYFSSEVVDEVICQLKDKKYIDDERVAYNYICSSKNAKTRCQIKQKLNDKGIDGYITDRLLEELFDDEDEKRIIIKYIDKYTDESGMFNPREDKDKINKIISALYRKGISYSKIKEVMSLRLCDEDIV